MSAWSTNGRHNAIVADGLVVHGIRDATAVARTYGELALENERSLHHRYGDDLAQQATQRAPYVPGGEVHPVSLLGLARSWVYQSCEHPGFSETTIARDVQTLIETLEQQYPGVTYGDLHHAWSIADLDEADNDRWANTAAGATSPSRPS